MFCILLEQELRESCVAPRFPQFLLQKYAPLSRALGFTTLPIRKSSPPLSRLIFWRSSRLATKSAGRLLISLSVGVHDPSSSNRSFLKCANRHLQLSCRSAVFALRSRSVNDLFSLSPLLICCCHFYITHLSIIGGISCYAGESLL